MKYVSPTTSLAEALSLLRAVRFSGPLTGPASGSLAPLTGPASGSPSSRGVDICVKVLSISEAKQVTKAGQTLTVAEIEVTDDSMIQGYRARRCMSVWKKKPDELVKDIPINEAVSFVGCTAVKDNEGGIKLNLWENSLHVIRGGDRAQTLSSMDVDSDPSTYRHVTAQFTPTHAPISAQGEAVPTCAAALAAVTFNILGQQGDKLFQINRCLMDAPVTREALFTQDGKRLYVRAWIRDWTGPCEVDVVETAVPRVYGLTLSLIHI